MAMRMGGVRPMPRRRPPQQPYDTSGMDPEMIETMGGEMKRKDMANRMYGPISQGVQKAQKTFDLGGFIKGLFGGKKK